MLHTAWKEDTSVKTLSSPFSAELWWHCVFEWYQVRGRYQSEKKRFKVYFLEWVSNAPPHSHTLVTDL